MVLTLVALKRNASPLSGTLPWRRGIALALSASLLAFTPFSIVSKHGIASPGLSSAFAQQPGDLPPDDLPPDDAPPPDDVVPDDVAPPPADSAEALRPGEAVVTRFSHWTDDVDPQGKPVKIIDVNGVVASAIDVGAMPEPPFGQHWLDEPQRLFVTAGEIGQVFGVTIADKGDGAPDIYLAATSAFGLHRMDLGDGKRDWMTGMFGPDAGPGTIWRLSAANGYRPEKFVDATLDGRQNTAAALGNLAFDANRGLLFVSDLETGMIHAFDTVSGTEQASWDHGVNGRTDFADVQSGEQLALDPVAFDPQSSARLDDCPSLFDRTPSCWNIADFRRRVWGLDVRVDAQGTTRLYYSVWGSDAYGNPDWAQAGDDRRNAVWSVALTEEGQFDPASVRREFFMPAFWPDNAAANKAGNSNAVSDITFPQCGDANQMLVAERGGLRNLGLGKLDPFARPEEARVIRYEEGEDGTWRVLGRHDVGFLNHISHGREPAIFANAAGGADFGPVPGQAIDDGTEGVTGIYMTGDNLCSPDGRCSDKVRGVDADGSEVHGLQGMPADALSEMDGPSTPDQLYRAVMIDTDINVDANGNPVAEELARDDATKIGDVAIHRVCEAVPALPILDQPGEIITPPEDWPVHTLALSHQKWASAGHRADRSWHWREGSWHTLNRSWHWREGSWHSANRSWHWRDGSWHRANRSWHWRQGSWHTANRSWHWRQGSWHSVNRSWHLKVRSWHTVNRSWNDGHLRNRSWHNRNRSWGNDHLRNRSWHVRGRTWGTDTNHIRNRSWHVRGQTWGKPGNQGNHILNRSWHVKGRTWGKPGHDGKTTGHILNRSWHVKGRTWGKPGNDGKTTGHIRNRSWHVKGRTWGKTDHDGKTTGHIRNRSWHVKGRTWGKPGNEGKTTGHVRNRSWHVKGRSWGKVPGHNDTTRHTVRRSRLDQGQHVIQPTHSRKASRQSQQPKHAVRKSRADQGHHATQPTHSRKASRQSQQPRHTVRKSRADQGHNATQPTHARKASRQQNVQPQHTRRKSQAQQGTQRHRKRLSQQQQHGG